MPDIVEMVDFTLSRKVRDNLLQFIQTLLYEQINAKTKKRRLIRRSSAVEAASAPASASASASAPAVAEANASSSSRGVSGGGAAGNSANGGGGSSVVGGKLGDFCVENFEPEEEATEFFQTHDASQADAQYKEVK